MKVGMAKICLDCEELFDCGEHCPRCGSPSWWYLRNWLPRLKGGDDVCIPAWQSDRPA